MAKKPARKNPRATIISKSSGREVDRKRSLAAKKAAATRKANRERSEERRSLGLHHKIIAAGAVIAVLLFTGLAIHNEIDAYAAAAKKTATTKNAKPESKPASTPAAKKDTKADTKTTVKSAQSIQAPSGYCLDNAGGTKKNGNKIQLYTCNGTKAQTWSIDKNGNVKNANGYCLDTLGTKPKAGDKARLNECVKGSEQQWKNVNGTLVNKKSGLCLQGEGNRSTLSLQKCASKAKPKKSQKLAYNYVQVTTTGNKAVINSANSKVELNKDHGSSVTVDLKNRNGGGATKAGSTTKGSAVSKSSKQELAKQIITSGKVKFLDGNNSSAAKRRSDIADIASGKVKGSSLPCGMNVNVLRVIEKLSENHNNIIIGDTNSLCDGNNVRHNPGSRHYGGNGSAVDITGIDGIYFGCTAGCTEYNAATKAKVSMILKEIKQILKTGNGLYHQSQVGQSECMDMSGLGLGKVKFINDYCNHLHVDFPPFSDKDLKYTAAAY